MSILFFLVLCFAMTASVLAARKMSVQTVQKSGTAKYIPMKPKYKNLILEPMTVDSVADELASIVVLCAVLNDETVKRLPLSNQKLLS
jgi:hypothetical protein